MGNTAICLRVERSVTRMWRPSNCALISRPTNDGTPRPYLDKCLTGSRIFQWIQSHMRCLLEAPIRQEQQLLFKKKNREKNTYNSRCSLMVTHSTTNLPLIGLTLGEQTGSRIFQWIWSYVIVSEARSTYITIS
ncbi:hypothetical protein HDV63DRAFT_164829 [Trichoderma sp. SZMC 28014]